MAFVNERDENGKWQTVDKEKEIILKNTRGPHPEYGYEFELSFDDQVIKFRAESGMQIHGKPKLGEKHQYEMNWSIYKIFIPKNLQDQKVEIFNAIKESLIAWGWNYNTQNAASVSVQFTQNL